jgi:hypothetical protein
MKVRFGIRENEVGIVPVSEQFRKLLHNMRVAATGLPYSIGVI